jgi:glucose-1-phosphate adenylyltransferase
VVSEGCEVYGTVENSVLFTGVTVAPGALVKYSIVMPGAVIERGASVEYAIVAEDAIIREGAKVGADPGAVPLDEWGLTVVASSVAIGPGVVLPPRAMAQCDIFREEMTAT